MTKTHENRKKNMSKKTVVTAFARSLPQDALLKHLKRMPFPRYSEDMDGNDIITPGTPVALVGPPGTGKTAAIHALAKEKGYRVVVLQLATFMPESMNGIPTVGEIEVWQDGKKVPQKVAEDLLPWWQAEALLEKNKKTIIFLDELSNADPAVQATALTLIEDRRLPSNKILPPETVIIAAMNSEEDSPNGTQIAPPMTNRFAWFAWKEDLRLWVKGMRVAFGKPMDAEEKFWRNMIADFLLKNPSHFYNRPEGDAGGTTPEEKEVNYNAWPSPRTWDKLSKILPHYERNDVISVAQAASSLVGFAAGTEFQAFLVSQIQLLDPAEALRNPNLIVEQKILEKTNDTKALVRNIVNYVVSVPQEEGDAPFENGRRLLKLLEMTMEKKPDGSDSDLYPLRTEFQGHPEALGSAMRVCKLMGEYVKLGKKFWEGLNASQIEAQRAAELAA